MMDRSSGIVTRKEDQLKDIYEFLKSNYTSSKNDEIEFRDDSILIPMYRLSEFSDYATLVIKRDELIFNSINVNKYGWVKCKRNMLELYNKIEEKFSPKVVMSSGVRYRLSYGITPEGGVTKEFCREFINFILDNLADNVKIEKNLHYKND